MILAALSALIAIMGVAQCLLGLAAVRRFAASASSSENTAILHHPPVTILKPLCGAEPLLDAALESCFTQNYPDYQIVFGVRHATDPALAIIERLRQRYPTRDISVVVDATLHGANRKVSNLINMLPSARCDILVVSDSDLHLPSDYLVRLVTALEKPGIGLATALYVGAPATPTGSAAALGATQISHVFLPGVLLSRTMGRQDCLGATAMVRRQTLARIGGFQPLAGILAEDNVLGQLVRKLGLSIGLADTVPATTVPELSFRPLWHHELRWTRTIRELAPVSLCASAIQYPLVWSALSLILTGGAPWAVGLFLASWAVRAACVRGIDIALRDRVGRRALPTPVWLLPLRDLLSIVEIGASFCVNKVTWRGQKIAVSGLPQKRRRTSWISESFAPFERNPT